MWVGLARASAWACWIAPDSAPAVGVSPSTTCWLSESTQRRRRARQRGHLDGGRRVRGRVAAGRGRGSSRRSADSRRPAAALQHVRRARRASSSCPTTPQMPRRTQVPMPRQSPLVAHGMIAVPSLQVRRMSQGPKPHALAVGLAHVGDAGLEQREVLRSRRPGRPTSDPARNVVSALRTASHFVWFAGDGRRHRARAVHHDVEVERHLLGLWVATAQAASPSASVPITRPSVVAEPADPATAAPTVDGRVATGRARRPCPRRRPRRPGRPMRCCLVPAQPPAADSVAATTHARVKIGPRTIISLRWDPLSSRREFSSSPLQGACRETCV